MPNPTLIILCLALAAVTARAQVDTSAVQVREITVEADRWLGDGFRASIPSTAMGASMLDRLAPQRVSDALIFVPGVDVRQYGGLGGLRTISVRGGSTAQTLVMLDGIRMSSAQNGSVDLGMIPGAIVGEIDVVRGGAAALYGANALSGVVDIRLRPVDHTSAWATVGGGSFDEGDLRVGATALLGQVGITAGIDVMDAQGGYPTRTWHDGRPYDVNRSNADARNINVVVRAAHASWSVMALARSARRGVPGPLIEGVVVPSRARLDDADGIIGIKGTVWQHGAWTLSMTSGLRAWDQTFRDPDATVMGPAGIDATYVQRDASAAVVLQYVTPALLQRVRVEGAFADLRGRMLQPDVGSLVLRRSIAVAGEWQWQATSSLLMRSAMRLDALSDAGGAVSPLLAVRWDAATDVAVRASWSYNFRPPSFNELYYLNYGTRSLRPERSHTVNAGASWRGLGWLALDADAFIMRTRDQIVSVPTSAVATSAQNVGVTTGVGIECGARASLLQERVMVHWTYTLQDVRDRSGRDGVDGSLLPYVPQELIAIGAHYADADVQGGMTWTYASHRFALAGEAFSSMLPSYGLLGLYVGVVPTIAPWHVNVRLQLDNLLDARYELIRGYPMPGASFKLLTTIRWGT